MSIKAVMVPTQITRVLKASNLPCSRNRVAKRMQILNLELLLDGNSK